jgi:hypothetical protein
VRRLDRLPSEPPDTKAPPEPSGMPASWARYESAWFSAITTPLDSSQLVPFSPEQATTMSKSSELLVGALGMKAKKPGESIETTAGASECLKKSKISSGSWPSRRMKPLIVAGSIGCSPPKSRGTGSIDIRSRQ